MSKGVWKGFGRLSTRTVIHWLIRWGKNLHLHVSNIKKIGKFERTCRSWDATMSGESPTQLLHRALFYWLSDKHNSIDLTLSMQAIQSTQARM
jgi:hypothetical protein